MRLRRFFAEVHDAEPLLSSVAWLHVVVLLISVISIPYDPREILGLSPWIKPIKFAFSIAIYLWTLAWFLRYLRGPRIALQMVRWGVSIAMIAEISCIWLQSARGTTSHFNVGTAFDSTLFGIMGVMILLNTVFIVVVLALFFWDPGDLAPVYLWSIRLGLFVFFLGSMEAMAMIFNQAHTVGVADGGPGLPFVNWSTEAGDLRIAHFIGLHALQIIPLIGHRLSQTKLSTAVQGALLTVSTAVYSGVGYAIFRQALKGVPLIRM